MECEITIGNKQHGMNTDAHIKSITEFKRVYLPKTYEKEHIDNITP